MQVFETTEGWIEVIEQRPYLRSPQHWYYDVKRKLRSASGKIGETPRIKMADNEVKWVQEKFAPFARQRTELQRKEHYGWYAMASASMVREGLHLSMTRGEFARERSIRFAAWKESGRIPTSEQVEAALKMLEANDAPVATQF